LFGQEEHNRKQAAFFDGDAYPKKVIINEPGAFTKKW
jgi:hypothetical protein